MSKYKGLEAGGNFSLSIVSIVFSAEKVFSKTTFPLIKIVGVVKQWLTAP